MYIWEHLQGKRERRGMLVATAIALLATGAIHTQQPAGNLPEQRMCEFEVGGDTRTQGTPEVRVVIGGSAVNQIVLRPSHNLQTPVTAAAPPHCA